MSDALHVHPVGDLIEHELADDCPCGPEQRPVEQEAGGMGWFVVHHALDGREMFEERDDG